MRAEVDTRHIVRDERPSTPIYGWSTNRRQSPEYHPRVRAAGEAGPETDDITRTAHGLTESQDRIDNIGSSTCVQVHPYPAVPTRRQRVGEGVVARRRKLYAAGKPAESLDHGLDQLEVAVSQRQPAGTLKQVNEDVAIDITDRVANSADHRNRTMP